eukprot:1390726-Amorphochlora_amoeboformis.AAC.1
MAMGDLFVPGLTMRHRRGQTRSTPWQPRSHQYEPAGSRNLFTAHAITNGTTSNLEGISAARIHHTHHSQEPPPGLMTEYMLATTYH